MTGRDLSPLLDGGRCTVCGEAAPERHVVPWVETHAARHLADGSAVTVSAVPTHGGRRTTKVVPTSSIPDEKPKRPRLTTRGLVLPKGFKRWTP